jgi:glutamyl-tRNA(Gln) amidotransferase subunit D
MTKDKPQGYKEESQKFFDKNNIYAWNEIEIKKGTSVYKGILLPRNKFAKDGFIEIKLKNGYNIGIEISSDTSIKVLGEKPPMSVEFQGITVTKDKNKPNVTLLGTGGTIASRLDYVTGGVIPAFKPQELFASVPELSEICNLDTETVFQIFSEDMEPSAWVKLAKRAAELSNKGVDGIMIGHGTDTLSYSTSALSFLVQNLKCPVVFVGAQRSSDRPSSDAALNLINAATVASKADLAEVILCMLGSTSHTYGLMHRGALVRKMHSSVRHTFRTIHDIPLGKVENGAITFFKKDVKRKSQVNKDVETTYSKNVESKVGLMYSYPGLNPDIIDMYVDKGYKGFVIAGTGLGHIPHKTLEAIKRAKEQGLLMVMALQTIWGFTGMDVYETGREEQQLGIIPAKSMLPETAFAKMCWVLGNYSNLEEAKKIMLTNIAGEIIDGEPENGFKVLQGIE